MRTQVWLAVTAAFAALNFYAVSQAPERDGDTVYSYDVFASAVVVYGLLLRRRLRAHRGPATPRAPRLAGAAFLGRALGLCARRSGRDLRRRCVPALALARQATSRTCARRPGTAAARGPTRPASSAIVLIGPVVEELLYRGVGVGLLAAARQAGRDRRHGADVRPRARPAAVARRLHLVRGRHGVDPPAHGQPLSGAARARCVQRVRDDRAACSSDAAAILDACAARSSCLPVSPSPAQLTPRRRSSPPRRHPPQASRRCA